MFLEDGPLSIYANIRVHLGLRENFHSIHPSGVHTHFSQKSASVPTDEILKEKLAVHLFSKHVGLLANKLTIFVIYFFQFLSTSFTQLFQEKD